VPDKSLVARARPSALRPSSALRACSEFAGLALHGRRCVAIRVGKRAQRSCAVSDVAVSLFRLLGARRNAPIVA
jgi:hypothetical protein